MPQSRKEKLNAHMNACIEPETVYIRSLSFADGVEGFAILNRDGIPLSATDTYADALVSAKISGLKVTKLH